MCSAAQRSEQKWQTRRKMATKTEWGACALATAPGRGRADEAAFQGSPLARSIILLQVEAFRVVRLLERPVSPSERMTTIKKRAQQTWLLALGDRPLDGKLHSRFRALLEGFCLTNFCCTLMRGLKLSEVGLDTSRTPRTNWPTFALCGACSRNTGDIAPEQTPQPCPMRASQGERNLE